VRYERRKILASWSRTVQFKRAANRKTRNKPRGVPKRTEWLVCEPNDRAALIAIGERCVRGWREGEPLMSVRHMPGCWR
jgi:hypothetical protein